MVTSRFGTYTFVILLISSLILVVHLLFGFITPVVMAMVMVTIFYPLYQRLLRAVKGREYLASSLSTLLIFLLVLIPLSIFFISLVQQGLMLFQKTQRLTGSTDISQMTSSLKSWLDLINRHLSNYGLSISTDRIINGLTLLMQAFGRWVYEGAAQAAANLLSLAFNFVLTVALVFVFFVRGREAKEFLVDLIPLPRDEKDRLVSRVRELSFAVFVGNGLISILEGILGGLSFFAFSISGSLIWGVVMTITAFLPVIGASIVVIPATIYLFLMGQTWQAVAFLSFNSLQLTILETVVKPRLIGTRSQMHAVLVLMSVLAGVQVYGAFGLFYGPLLITLFLALAEIYKEHYRGPLLKIKPVSKDSHSQ